MRKIYSLLATVCITLLVSAQTTVLSEKFDTYTKGGNTTSSGATAPDGTDIYNPGTAVGPITPSSNFPNGNKVYSAGGMAKLGTSSVAGTMTSKVLDLSTDGGNIEITFDVKGWTATPSTILVKVTNLTTQTISYAAIMSGTPETKTINFSGGQANSTVTFETPTTSFRAYLDNITIKTVPTLGTANATKSKINLVKNTIVDNIITFGVKTNVQLININGQIVKNLNVDNGTSLDVSSLSKGIYIVTGEVDGQKVSQKIIKK